MMPINSSFLIYLFSNLKALTSICNVWLACHQHRYDVRPRAPLEFEAINKIATYFEMWFHGTTMVL
jgi:hypothetical protein